MKSSRTRNLVLGVLGLLTVLFFQNCSQENFTNSSPKGSAQSVTPPGGTSSAGNPTNPSNGPTVTVTSTTCSTQNPTCDVTLTLTNATGPVSLLFSTECLDANGNVVACPASGPSPNGQGTLPYGTPNTDFSPDYMNMAVTLTPNQTTSIPINDVAPAQTMNFQFLIPWAIQNCEYSGAPNTACTIVIQ